MTGTTAPRSPERLRLSSSHGLPRSASLPRDRALKREAARLDEARGWHRGSVGFLGSYRFRQLASSPGLTRNGSIRHVGKRVESQRVAAFAAVGIVGQRQQQIDEQRIAAHAGAPIAGGRTDAPERVDRDQDEGRRGDHGDGKNASPGTIGGMAQPQPAHRPTSRRRGAAAGPAAARRTRDRHRHAASRTRRSRRRTRRSCRSTFAALATISANPSAPKTSAPRQRHVRDRRRPVASDGVRGEHPGEQAALGDPRQAAQRPPEADHRGGDRRR